MRTPDDSSDAAAAFQAAAALDQYEQDLLPMLREGPAREDCLQLRSDLQALRLAFAELPRLSVPWAALLISHFKLLALYDSHPTGGAAARALQQHQQRIAQVSALCRAICKRRGAADPARSHVIAGLTRNPSRPSNERRADPGPSPG